MSLITAPTISPPATRPATSPKRSRSSPPSARAYQSERVTAGSRRPRYDWPPCDRIIRLLEHPPRCPRCSPRWAWCWSRAGCLSYADPTAAGSAPRPTIETLAPVGSRRPAGAPTDAPPAVLDPVGLAIRRPRSPSGAPRPAAAPGETDEPTQRPEPDVRPGREVATRVVVPALSIDLPVIKGNDGYPCCNVAMYLHTANSAAKDAFGQPGEGRATYLYAHARDGMFGPIYELAIAKDTPEQDAGDAGPGLHQRLQAPPVRDPTRCRLHVTNLDERARAPTASSSGSRPPRGRRARPARPSCGRFPVSVADADPAESRPQGAPVTCG